MNPRRVGFTLIEVLIVVALMAVLAAVIIPQFSDSTTDAKRSTLEYNLRTLRQQIQVYRIDHNGLYPELKNKALEQLTTKTDVEGNPGSDFGPYIRADLPLNPFNLSNEVKAGSGTGPVAGGNVGWQYDEATGQIWPNNSEWWPD
jgi:type II secretion system protein G